MIDVNLWQELTVFEKYGTLSKAAEELFISQPALSRSLIEKITQFLSVPVLQFLFLNLQSLPLLYIKGSLFLLKLMIVKYCLMI